MAKVKNVVEQAPTNETGTENNGTPVVNDAPATPAPTSAPEPTSEKLTELKGQKSEAIKKQADFVKNGGDLESEDFMAMNMEVYRINNLIKGEIANIAQAAKKAEIEEKRNARVKMVDTLINEVLLSYGITTRDEAADAKFAEQRQTVANELLARFSTSTPAKSTGDKPAGEKGATGRKIIELYEGYIAAGKNHTEAVKTIIDQDKMSRGTTGAVILQYRKDKGLA